MNAYLKTKYAGAELNEREQEIVSGMLPDLLRKVSGKISTGKRFLSFLRPWRSVQFFFSSDGNEDRLG
jgi:hypothetical protein